MIQIVKTGRRIQIHYSLREQNGLAVENFEHSRSRNQATTLGMHQDASTRPGPVEVQSLMSRLQEGGSITAIPLSFSPNPHPNYAAEVPPETAAAIPDYNESTRETESARLVTYTDAVRIARDPTRP
jgi:hypothetical protein